MLQEKEIITIVDEEGYECRFVVFEEFEFEGQKYIQIMDKDDFEEFENGDVDQEVTILRVEEDEDGEEFLTDIEDDEEFNRVCNHLDRFYKNESEDNE